MTVKLAVATANAMVGSLSSTAGTGAKLVIYAGTRPANPDTAATGSTTLATLTVPSWGAASGGSSTAGTISSVTASATGTASWFRLYKTDGTTAVLDGDCGTGTSGDLNFSTLSFVSGGTVNVTGFTLTEPAD